MTPDEEHDPGVGSDEIADHEWPGNVSPAALEDYQSDHPRRWPFYVVLAIVLLGGLVAAAPMLISSSWLSGEIRDWMKANLDTPATFQTLDVSWDEGIKLTGLEVHESRNSEKPLLYAPLVEIDAAFWPLLVQRLDVRKFVFHDPVVRIAQNEDGSVKSKDVVRTKKVRKKRGDAGEQEVLILPRMDVPIEVRNLKLIFVDADDHEIERTGIVFSGHVTTRDGPTTFSLRVPDGNGELSVDAEATLFAADGALLATDRISVRSKVLLTDVDAATNRDLLLLFMGDAPTEGRLDGQIDVTTTGTDVDGSLDLTVSGLATGRATGTRNATGQPDLVVQGTFRKRGDAISLTDIIVRGEGVDATANVSGEIGALAGSATLDADLSRAAAALRGLGFDVPEGVAGRLDGQLTFTRETGAADGRLIVTDLRLPSTGPDGQAFVLASASGALRAKLGTDTITLDSLEVRLPDGTLTAAGSFGTDDGTLDVRAVIAGDVGALVGRARDLGLVPREMALAGTLDAAISARRGPLDDGVALTIEKLSLRGDGVAIDVGGSVAADGALDLTARGDGSLEKLLASGAAAAPGVDLSAIRGTFSFAATARGAADAPVVVLDRLRLDGDVQIDAQGTLGADGALACTVRADTAVGDAVKLARRLGLIEGEVPLGGRLSVDVQAAGTLAEPEIPKATIAITDGPLETRLVAAVTAAGAVTGTFNLGADLSALLGVAHAQKVIERNPGTAGRLTVSAVLGGSRDALEIPSGIVRIEGPADVTLEGSLDVASTLTTKLQFRGALQPLSDLVAALRGEESQAVAGDYEGVASIDGTLDRPQFGVQRLVVRSSGLTAKAQAIYRPDGTGESSLEIAGPLEGLFDVLHAAGIAGSQGGTGRLDFALQTSISGSTDAQSVVGSVTGSVRNLILVNADQPGAQWVEPDLRFSVPSFRYDVAAGSTVGPVAATVTTAAGLRAQANFEGGTAQQPLRIDAKLVGPIQTLLDAAAFVTGGRAEPVPGELDAAFRVDGPLDSARVEVLRADLTSDTLTVEATGTATGVGSDGLAAKGRAKVRGALSSLIAIAKAAGAVDAETDIRGSVDASIDLLSFERSVATVRVAAVATEVHVVSPPVGSGTFREPRIEIPETTLQFETETGNVRPFQAIVRMTGLDLATRLEVSHGPASGPDAAAPLLIDATAGRLTIEEEFTRNHPELLPDMRLGGALGTFAFRGDVAAGLERAQAWVGDVDLTLTRFVAPYVDAPRLHVVGTVRDGTLTLSPLDADVNGGTARGTATLGLVGEKPVHHFELHAKNVRLETDLAALLSRASPMLAVGESGRTGGTTGLDVTLRAKGLDADTLKKTLNGDGTLTLSNVFAESDNWLGKVLELVGAGGGRLDVADAKVPFVVKRGQVTTQDVAVSGGSLDMLLGGTVGLDGALDYAFKVRPTKRGGAFDKYATLLDPQGYLPLRLEGGIADPSLKLPTVADVVKGGLGGLLDGLKDKLDPRDKDDDDEDKPDDGGRRRRDGKKKRNRDGGGGDGSNEPE